MTAAAGALPGFSDRVLKFMERVEHRVATTDCERREAFRLRYEAYVRNALMAPGPDRRLFDARYDNSENAWITMTFVDGELAGSLRVNVGVGVDADLPSLRVYPDVVTPRLKAGQVVVEYTRLAAKLSVSIAHPELAYVIMRPGYMAAEHFDADLAIATPRLEHMAFYRHVFGVQYNGASHANILASLPSSDAWEPNFASPERTSRRAIPSTNPQPIEREALFGPSEREIDLGFRTVDSAGLSRLGAELSTA